MLNEYGPILIFMAIAAAFPLVTLWIMKSIGHEDFPWTASISK